MISERVESGFIGVPVDGIIHAIISWIGIKTAGSGPGMLGIFTEESLCSYFFQNDTVLSLVAVTNSIT